MPDGSVGGWRERVRRCVEIARQVFSAAPLRGDKANRPRVVVRWWDFYQHPVAVAALAPAEREAAFRSALAQLCRNLMALPDADCGRKVEWYCHFAPGAVELRAVVVEGQPAPLACSELEVCEEGAVLFAVCDPLGPASALRLAAGHTRVP